MILLRVPARLDVQAVRGLRQRWPMDVARVELDFAAQRFVLPAGTVGLACLVQWARDNGQAVDARFDGCDNAGYWERMDFCRRCGFAGPPPGARHAARGRFSELRPVADIDQVDAITEALVSVTAPQGGDALRIHAYVVSEALNNVCQHSAAAGYCASQCYPAQGTAHFAIADSGIGLRQALARFAPATDSEAIELALEVGITGRSRAAQLAAPRHLRNRGIGLSALTRLIAANRGSYTLWSGEAMLMHTGGHSRVLPAPCWQGVFLAAIVPHVNFLVSDRDIIRELTPELREAEAGMGKRPLRRIP